MTYFLITFFKYSEVDEKYFYGCVTFLAESYGEAKRQFDKEFADEGCQRIKVEIL